jgi:hypothetical protein
MQQLSRRELLWYAALAVQVDQVSETRYGEYPTKTLLNSVLS